MTKKLLLIILTLLIILPVFSYTPYLQKGTLIKVYAKEPITTKNLEEGSIVYFISPADVWVVEDKLIEKGDVFQGYVSMLKMPVLGVNAALSIKTTGIIKVNGEKQKLDGRIIFRNSDVLGGTLTNPLSYNKSFFPRKVYGNRWGGTYRYVPSGEYEFGQHVRINSHDNIFVQLDEDYYN